MERSLPTLPGSTNKREQIIKLLSEGNHSTKNIARIVGTSEAYVWKEKSKLKTRGFLISRNTEVISKTSQLNIYSNNTLLGVPQLDTEGLKKLYSEFGIGKKPAQIVAENGFHPELVENEYQRFSRLTEHDVAALQRKFFVDFNQGLATTNNNTTKRLVEKYNKEGKLTIDEFITLIKLMLNEKYQVGKDSVTHNIINGILPDGWKAETCITCNKPITGSIVDPTKKLRMTISDSFIPLTHSSCRV
jgi:biotin operon repressor